MTAMQVTWIAVTLMACPVFAIYQDLTWVMDTTKISYLPMYAADQFRFRYNIAFKGNLDGTKVFVAYNTYSTVEHMGTHIDAPYHFYESGKTMDQVPLEDLIGPLVKIDIHSKAQKDPDAIVSVKDLEDWEAKNGRIPDGSFILMSSGWDDYYGDNVKYVGTNVVDGPTHSPGFGEEAAKWLKSNRKIKGVGVDTVKCDAGNSGTLGGEYVFPAHQILQPAGILCIENLKSIAKVPECGARFSAFPIMMRNGTGTQARAFAEWHEGVGYMTHCKGQFKEGMGTFSTNETPKSLASAILVISTLFSIHFMM